MPPKVGVVDDGVLQAALKHLLDVKVANGNKKTFDFGRYNSEITYEQTPSILGLIDNMVLLSSLNEKSCVSAGHPHFHIAYAPTRCFLREPLPNGFRLF